MKEFIKIVLHVVNVLASISVIFWGIIGAIYEIIGPEMYEKLLSKLNIPWNFDQIFKIAYICLIVFLISLFVWVKFFDE